MSHIAVYTSQQEGPDRAFLVAPAPYPKFWALIAVGAVLLVIAINLASFIVMVVAAAALWFGLTDPRPPRHKSTCSFRVSPESISYDGGTFKKADIQELVIKTGYESTDPIGRIGAEIGGFQKAQVDQVTRSLTLRARGIDHILAGGLDPQTAAALLAEVNAAMVPTVAVGDFLLVETEFGVYRLERATATGREIAAEVPHKDNFADTVRFGLSQAGDTTLWLQKIADRGAPPTEIPRSILESPGFAAR